MNAMSAITNEFCAFKRRLGLFASMTSIHVRFIATAPLKLQIKHAMKTSVAFRPKPIIPSLFQIASRVENFAPHSAAQAAPSLDQTPFIELMLHPDKLEAALKIAKRENDAFDASRTFSRSPASGTTLENSSENEKTFTRSRAELKTIEFHLEAPFAGSVKLAADFTDWEKSSLDLVKAEDGVWHTTVPLPPGHYSYRFIVDGEWCDDPNPILRLHENPFGRANAVVEVA
jgi:hypothetical protein